MQNNTSNVFVAIVGKPNVGKSSLLNRLIGEKAAIVSPKPQTTRTRVTGILTNGSVQYVFFDTPGLHKPRTKLGQWMAKTAGETATDGDVVVMLFDPEEPINPTELEMCRNLNKSTSIAVINKADTIRLGEVLALRKIELEALDVFSRVFVVSAKTGEGCDTLLEQLAGFAMEGPHFFSDDMYTDQPEKEIVAEIVREKILNNLREEIPHGTVVEVERFKERETGNMVDIDVIIYCERKSHKGMVIGKSGQMLKTIASEARKECEDLLGAKIHMQCWVKVSEGWRDNEKMLNRMGWSKR